MKLTIIGFLIGIITIGFLIGIITGTVAAYQTVLRVNESSLERTSWYVKEMAETTVPALTAKLDEAGKNANGVYQVILDLHDVVKAEVDYFTIHE